jgi:uncharacterized protein YlxW (UPF0749 family)
MSEILSLVDIIEQKLRKEKELAYYEEELRKLEKKMFFLKKEIQMTNFIIDAVRNEKDGQLQKRLEIINKED